MNEITTTPNWSTDRIRVYMDSPYKIFHRELMKNRIVYGRYYIKRRVYPRLLPLEMIYNKTPMLQKCFKQLRFSELINKRFLNKGVERVTFEIKHNIIHVDVPYIDISDGFHSYMLQTNTPVYYSSHNSTEAVGHNGFTFYFKTQYNYTHQFMAELESLMNEVSNQSTDFEEYLDKWALDLLLRPAVDFSKLPNEK